MRAGLFLTLSAGPHRLSTLAAPRARAVMTGATLTFGPMDGKAAAKTILIGRKSNLLGEVARQAVAASGCPPELWTALIDSVGDMGDDGKSASTLFMPAGGGGSVCLYAAVLPEACSRHASPVRPHAVTALLAGAAAGAGSVAVVAVLDDLAHALGTAGAIGRAFPLYSAKKDTAAAAENKMAAAQKKTPVPKVTSAGPGLAAAPKGATEGEESSGGGGAAVRVSLVSAVGGAQAAYGPCAAVAMGVRRAARLVDMPPAELTTTALVAEARGAAARLAAAGKVVQVQVITGEELLASGHGLIHAVGRAAVEPPALVVLSYLPASTGVPNSAGGAQNSPARTVALVGKGIVYDTGGLALKTKEGMCGMKADMGGAAALLAGFEAAVQIGTGGTSVHLLLCCAENAIGPNAVRNDDVIRGLSGLSVEINNSDAEGRLVLADGVAHATALPPLLPGLEGQPDLVIDMATLTGAQMIATGKRHAAIVANSEPVEAAAAESGRRSGDLVCPLPYAPEFYRKEFASKVADMKNSVKDRSNAQASCAANFISEHLHPAYTGGWLHVDLAGPAFLDDRGTGFGVGLVVDMLGVLGGEPEGPAPTPAGKKRARS